MEALNTKEVSLLRILDSRIEVEMVPKGSSLLEAEVPFADVSLSEDGTLRTLKRLNLGRDMERGLMSSRATTGWPSTEVRLNGDAATTVVRERTDES